MAVTLENATKHTITKLKVPPASFEYNFKDAILYALSIGITTNDEHGLRYLYENSEDFQVFPSFASLMVVKENVDLLMLPGLEVKPGSFMHLEQYIEQHRLLPKDCKLRLQLQCLDVLDRGSGSQFIVQTVASDDHGPLFTTMASVVVMGDGNFGGKPKTDKNIPKTAIKPKEEPDAVLETRIGDQQNVLFRLCGDLNPLHIDPEFAKKAKLSRPILHGNCTLGIAAQLIIRKYADSDARRFKCIMVRFVQVVYPKDTLQIRTWKRGNRIHFEARTKEAALPVLTGGYVDILDKPMEV